MSKQVTLCEGGVESNLGFSVMSFVNKKNIVLFFTIFKYFGARRWSVQTGTYPFTVWYK